MPYVIGVDVGGTFTDTVLWRVDGALATGKAFTTHDALETGMLDSLAVAAGVLGLSADEALAGAGLVLHGTTVGTNAIVERRGARVGLVCTRGHADAISMMRAAGRVKGLGVSDLLDLAGSSKPPALVARERIFEVDERATAGGATLLELTPAAIADAADRARAAGCEALAVAFLWSFTNPANEDAAVAALQAALPDVYVTASHDIAPRMGEYERTVATVINAHVGPTMRTYLADLSAALRARGFAGQLLVMTCAGGVLRSEAASSRALLTIGSGPAAGVLGCVRLAAERGEPDVVATDMGGTTFDVAIVDRGQPIRRSTSIANQYEYFVETLDVQSIGAGGGSIATVDEATGTLHVGPRSAGSLPGPACYGRGGTAATVTDADLVLGYLDPGRFLDGRLQLDRDAAERALDALGRRLGLSAVEVAAGICRIADERMADLIRRMTVQQGFDPRTFTIYAYGGAGPLHVGAYGRSLGCRTAIVPLGGLAPVWSAFGAAAADVTHVRAHALLLREPFDADRLWGRAGELAAEVGDELRRDGFDHPEVAVETVVEMRYSAQIHALDVACTGIDPDVPGWRDELIARFEREYETRYGHGTGYRAAGVEIATVKVVGRGLRTVPGLPAHRPVAEAPRERRAYWHELGDWAETPVHDHAALGPEQGRVVGPCIIDLPATSAVVRPGQAATVDELGNVVIELATRAADPRAEAAPSLEVAR